MSETTEPTDGQTSDAVEKTAAEWQAELETTKDQFLRALAEAENGRRRAEREALESRAYAIDRFARDLLGVADNLGRAVAAVSEEQRAGGDEVLRNLLQGVEMTETALVETLARHGVKRIGAKGDKFDPNLHQAVAQIPSDAPAGAVAEVFQAGYVLAERTLRAAMVAVSLGAGDKPAEGGGAGSVDMKV
jgi:molecular chaperone GrpE